MAHPQSGLEICANCGRTIGNLETPHIYNDRIICPECSARFGVQGLKHISRTDEEISLSPSAAAGPPRRGRGKFLRRAGLLLTVVGAAAALATPRLDLHQDNAAMIFAGGIAVAAVGILVLLGGIVRGMRH